MSSLNVAARALTTNQAVLQVIGHNIANVNTDGYSRQTVALGQVPGQKVGSGYFGKGVEITGVTRSYNAYLTRESNLTQSVAASDAIRFQRLQQLEQLFPMGEAGMGTQLNNFLNSWADVAASPTNQTARGVVLSSAEEFASRLRQTSTQLDELGVTTRTQIEAGIREVNRIVKDIADLNQRIAVSGTSGGAPNDLLDQRDKLVADLNQYVQTSTLIANDGTMTVFAGGSYPLVLGTTVTELVNPPPTNSEGELTLAFGNKDALMNTSLLGGGQLQGLLKFHNEDLNDVRNQLGRLALSLTEQVNRQHRAGLDLNGQAGLDFYRAIDLSNAVLPSDGNGGSAQLSVAVSTAADAPTSFVATDYELSFDGSDWAIKRLSDNTYLDATGAFGSATPVALTMPQTFDGLTLTLDSGAAQAGDTFVLRPFADVARQVQVALTSPTQLAAASPVLVEAGSTNGSNLAVESLYRPADTSEPVGWDKSEIYFGSDPVSGTSYPGQYRVITYTPAATVSAPQDFVSGQPIVVDGFQLTLRGTPTTGDKFTVRPPVGGELMNQSVGNAQALLALRDVDSFQGYTLSDGYIPVFAEVSTSIQTAKSAATFSSSVADSAESARANQSGVNLDEEAARLVQFQQAYQASAKYLQAVQSLFDTLLSAFR